MINMSHPHYTLNKKAIFLLSHYFGFITSYPVLWLRSIVTVAIITYAAMAM